MTVPAPLVEVIGRSLIVNVPALMLILEPSGAVTFAKELLSKEISLSPFVETTPPLTKSTAISP